MLLEQKLKGVVWGRRKQAGAKYPYIPTMSGTLKMDIEDFIKIPRNEAVDLIDFCTPPFVNAATIIASSAPSQALEGIPQGRQVHAIRRDRTWMDDLVSFSRDRLTNKPVKDGFYGKKLATMLVYQGEMMTGTCSIALP